MHAVRPAVAAPLPPPARRLLPARVATVAAAEPWGPAFVRALYTANFAEDRDVITPEALAAILDELGQPASTVLARAQTDDVKERLRRSAACQRGSMPATA